MYKFGTFEAKAGQFVTFNIFGQPVMVSNIVTSWAAKICRVGQDGKLVPVN